MPSGIIPPHQWPVYRSVLRGARERGIPFALGGAFGYGAYTGCWRNTKDLDLYTLADRRDELIGVLGAAGLRDYYGELPYDRRWIYRGYRDGTIVDVIWAMANQRAQVDESWLTLGRELELEGEPVRAIPAEELLWSKLYVFQRDRFDWPDVLNLLSAAGTQLDWKRLLDRAGPDAPLIRAVLVVFAWIAPGRAAALPAWVWQRLAIERPVDGPEVDHHNVALLDSRPWFQT